MLNFRKLRAQHDGRSTADPLQIRGREVGQGGGGGGEAKGGGGAKPRLGEGQNPHLQNPNFTLPTTIYISIATVLSDSWGGVPIGGGADSMTLRSARRISVFAVLAKWDGATASEVLVSSSCVESQG